MSEFLDQMRSIIERNAKPEVTSQTTEVTSESNKHSEEVIKECHFIMSDGMRRLRHLAFKRTEEGLQVWSCKGRGLNPTVGLQESISAHVPMYTGNTRFERESNLREHLSKSLEESHGDVQMIISSLNEYTGGRWSVYKMTKEIV